MNINLQRLLAAAFFVFAGDVCAAEPDRKLVATVRLLDDALFEAGYNQCDLERMAAVIRDDLEFYHDQGGAQFGKDAFVAAMRNGLCRTSDYKARRELVEESLEVFPLYRNGELYGVIEQGVHRFHERYRDKAERPVGIAKFTLLWLLEGGEWKLARALSFDHAGLD